MKITNLVGMVFFVTALGLPVRVPAQPANAPAGQLAASPVEQGRQILTKILSAYPSLSASYQSPDLLGALQDPLAILTIPEEAWNRLSGNERALLGIYAQSLIPMVKADPFRFAGLSPNAPLAPRIRASVARMTSGSWGIMVGATHNDGKDVLYNHLAIRGDGKPLK